MRYLKSNTATRVTVGPFLDKTDGITPEVALTATNEKLTFCVDTAGVPTLVLDTTATASGGSNDLVHITNDDSGFYDLELAAADVNYVGRAILSITYATDHCPVFHEFEILPASVYDSLHNASGPAFSFGIIDQGTAASIAAGNIALRSGHGVSSLASALVVLTGGTAAIGKSRIITYSGSGDTFNVDPAWDANSEVTPSGTVTYIVVALPPAPTSTVPGVDVLKWNSTAVATPATAGYPAVTIKDGTGEGEIDTASGKVSIVSTDISLIQAGLATGATLADVKTKTDSLTFTVAGQVDVNLQSINDVAITGDGSGTPFGV